MFRDQINLQLQSQENIAQPNKDKMIKKKHPIHKI